MRAEMRTDLTAALKARDRVATAALRSALAAIENAEAVPAEARPAEHGADRGGMATGPGATDVERRRLTEADLRVIVETEVQERSAAARRYQQLGRSDLAEQARAEAEVLDGYM
ncbi:GatB/YqeY domain-containing protein [Pseudonocardia sp. MH-G8]|uniref:GatB/YqeY domain-containing protein n=1 Tax=Pseudonocardia sp. MH-G8 TaxID=1854588 RepID=UPI000BA00A49|nr:GatB/YqeY domain-containing protein [Pseudonocardia sp. MH-G8]OZM78123.1 hypothetical protein CFP66_32795 [Pseudonocardia sp. MH-G8]